MSGGLLGHSDADVLTHAVMDAPHRAARLGDIGQLFPDTDPTYEGASSLGLLAQVGRLLAEREACRGKHDATLIAQLPMWALKQQMSQNLARALGISAEQVNVKATTEERAGLWTGRLRHGRPRCGSGGANQKACSDAGSALRIAVSCLGTAAGQRMAAAGPVKASVPGGGDSALPLGRTAPLEIFLTPSLSRPIGWGGEEEVQENYLIIARSVTYAQRMQNALSRAGVRCRIFRAPGI